MLKLVDGAGLLTILNVLRRSAAEERTLIETTNGVPFDAEEVAAAHFSAPGPKWTIDCDYYGPVVVCGIIPQRKGVYRTWFFAVATAWEEHGGEITRITRELISQLLASGFVHRLETVTLAEREVARTWYEKIGLTYEATQRGYYPDGRAAVTYVALRDAECG